MLIVKPEPEMIVDPQVELIPPMTVLEEPPVIEYIPEPYPLRPPVIKKKKETRIKFNYLRKRNGLSPYYQKDKIKKVA